MLVQVENASKYDYVILCVGVIMPRGKSTRDLSMLAMALVGYELEKKKIDERIRQTRALLTGKLDPSSQDAPKRRKLSVAARKRMSAAQKARWAAKKA